MDYNEELIKWFRIGYLICAFLCATGFVATLQVRWKALYWGERVLRIGLILEHMTLMYGAYIALTPPMLPPSLAAPLLFGSMGVMVTGFVIWYQQDRTLRNHKKPAPSLHRRLNNQEPT